MRIAIIEDDNDLAQLVEIWLNEAGHDCHLIDSGNAAIRQLQRDSFDLILLDWMLPDINGDEVLKWIRSNLGWSIPVIFVTARNTEEDIAFALNQGADDYITKPIRPKELIARIQVLGRRVTGAEPVQRVLEFAPYRFDLDRRELAVEGEDVSLTQKEFELSLLFFKNSGRLLSRAHLLENVWGRSSDINTRTLDTHVSRLRKKLNLNSEKGWRLTSIYHYGYRLEPAGDGGEESANQN
ncbi:MAG: response regulator transcription factor [Gammaproteobacteria bacterium]|nr:response regulator transcription factor [Gammaproteobacteria bacterium]